MYKDKTDDVYTSNWNTPKYMFNYLNKHFHFQLDPCASFDNYLELKYYFTLMNNDGLEQPWIHNAFVNPPYGAENERKWTNKALDEFEKYKKNIFILLPAKTEAPWFGKLFEKSSVIIFPQKRISFVNKDGKKINGNTMGSVIFGLMDIERNEDKYIEFIRENELLKIPNTIMKKDEGECSIFFPDRAVIEKNYSYIKKGL